MSVVHIAGVGNVTVLPPEFGDGWLSNAAADLVRLAIAFGGFDGDSLVRRIALAGCPGRTTNAATVERILGEIEDEYTGHDC